MPKALSSECQKMMTFLMNYFEMEFQNGGTGKTRDLLLVGQTSLWKILRNIGFKYKRDYPGRGLMELPYISAKWTEFLQNYKRANESNLKELICLYETLIFRDKTIGKSWQDSRIKSVKTTKAGGSRSIVFHAGSRKGFVSGDELVFSSQKLSLDYQGEMNHDKFLHWFEHQLLVNLDEPSMIVMDKASYHSVIKNKVRNAHVQKAEFQQWLKENNISFEEHNLKPQLLQLVKM